MDADGGQVFCTPPTIVVRSGDRIRQRFVEFFTPPSSNARYPVKPMEFLSRSEISVPIDEMPALERAFSDRARLVDRHAGFRGLELLRDIRVPGRYVLLTRWSSRDAFRAYMKSGDHARAHDRPHPDLGPVGSGGKLEQFDMVLDERVHDQSL